MRFRGSEKRPAVEAHFVLMRRNLNELPQFVRLMGMLGVKHIVAKNLNVITKPTDVADVLHDFFGNLVGALVRDATIETARAEAASLGVSFTFWGGFRARKLNVCIADPTSALFIGWDREVSPCCKLGHNTPTILRDVTLLRNLRFSFANVCKTDLDRITSGEEYFHFMHTMKSGRIPSQCDGCTLLHGLRRPLARSTREYGWLSSKSRPHTLPNRVIRPGASPAVWATARIWERLRQNIVNTCCVWVPVTLWMVFGQDE